MVLLPPPPLLLLGGKESLKTHAFEQEVLEVAVACSPLAQQVFASKP